MDVVGFQQPPPPYDSMKTRISYAFSLGRPESDSRFHKILLIAGPIIGFLLAFVCFYAIFFGVTQQSNRIFEKKDEEILQWQKQTEFFRRMNEGRRDGLLHEKYEDARVLQSQLTQCHRNNVEHLQQIFGLNAKVKLSQTEIKVQTKRLESLEHIHHVTLNEKDRQIQQLKNKLKAVQSDKENTSKIISQLFSIIPYAAGSFILMILIFGKTISK